GLPAIALAAERILSHAEVPFMSGWSAPMVTRTAAQATSNTTHQTKPDPRRGDVRILRLPPGRAGLFRCIGPVAAADHPLPAPRVEPGRAVGGCTPVTGMPAVGHPFAEIAADIVHAPGVGLVARHRRRAPVAIAITDEGVVPAPAAGRDILAAGEIARQLRRRAGVAPRVAPAAAGTQ